MIKKILCILLAASLISLSGCWSSHEVNELAITVAMGLDKTDEGYMLTEQIINPKAVAAKNPINSAPITNITVESSTIEGAINALLLKSSRLIYNTHLRLVVFGEEMARTGIRDALDYFARSYEFRTDFYFLVAKGLSASDILGTLMFLESIPGVGIFNMLQISSSENGVTKDVKIIELINSVVSDGLNPVLTGIEIDKKEIRSENVDAFKQTKDYDRLKFAGLCAFNKDKLIGWLSDEESKGLNYITDNLKYTAESINIDNSQISCNVLRPKSKIKAALVDGKPTINIDIKLKYGISELVGQFDVSTMDKAETINKALEKKITDLCSASIKKAQGELKSDIFGFGEAVHRTEKEYWNTVKDKWDKEFSAVPVNINVKAELINIGEITKSFFSEDK